MGSMGKDSSGTKGGRRGSMYFQGAEDVLNQGIISIMRSLTVRRPNQDMVAPPWDEDLTVLTADSEKNPGAVLGTVGARMSVQAATRDEIRGRNKAAGQKTSSEGTPTYLGGGAMQDDGTQGSIDPSDFRTQDSLTNAERAETRTDLFTSFRDAMKELKDKDPLWAMLVCLKLDLGCTPDGSMPDRKAQEILRIQAALPSSLSAQTPEFFLSRLGLADMKRGEADNELTRRVQAGGYWDRMKDLKGRTARRSSPSMPDGTPMKDRPADNAALAKEWDKFKATVRDAAGEAFKWIAKRMYELIAERNQDFARPVGQRAPTSWDMGRFLKAQFRPPLVKITESRPTRDEHEIKLEFKERQRSRGLSGETEDAYVTTKAWDILVKGNGISMIQVFPEGFEDNEFEFSIPSPKTCKVCGGSDDSCEACGGDGLALDASELRDLEYKLRNVLIRDQRKVGKG
jgi:hypothetical protein